MLVLKLVTNHMLSRAIMSLKWLLSLLFACLSVVGTTALIAAELPMEEAHYVFQTGEILHKEERLYGNSDNTYIFYQISYIEGFVVCETRAQQVRKTAHLKCYDTVEEKE